MVRLSGLILALVPVLLATTGIRSGKAAEAQAILQLGPILGHTWAQGAWIWIQASKAATSAVVIGERPRLQDGRRVSGPDLTAQSHFMGIVEVTGLRPATRYFYKILIDGRAGAATPSSFVTPPPDNTAGGFRFAVTSCAGLPADAAPAWAELARVPIDLLLQLGDNVYAGSTEPEVQRRIHEAHRRIPAYRRSLPEPRPSRSGMTGTTPATTATAPLRARSCR